MITWIKNWIEKKKKQIQESDNKQFKEQIKSYKILLDNSHEQNDLLNKQIEILNKDYSELLKEYYKIKEWAYKLYGDQKLEEFWNNKREKRNIFHRARESKQMDPRVFLGYDYTIPRISGKTHDEIALKCMKEVKKKIRYVKDSKGEFWQYAYETWIRRMGDCEDQAILLYVMMIISGVPYWRIRFNCGDVDGGGHAYITYLREKDNIWYIMDTAYWYTECQDYKLTWKNATKYHDIWFSCNQKYCYGKNAKEV